jgi:hypothetical protein
MEQRFLRFVNKTDTCWEWTGGKNTGGYGEFSFMGHLFRANRFAYELWINTIPVNNVVRHTCDNPSCVNPEHLETGTHKQNSRDMIDRGRHQNCAKICPEKLARGEKVGGSKLTQDDVREIKILLGFGISISQLGKQFNVDKSSVSNIKRGKTWKHITY